MSEAVLTASQATWRRSKIGELLSAYGGSIKTGPFGTKLKAAEYTRDGVPVISVGEIDYGRIVLRTDTPKVDDSVTMRMPEYLLHEGDIVFGRKGGVDRSAQVRRNENGWFLGSDGIRLRLPASCDAAFIAYQFQLKSHREWMLQHAAGSTMPSLNEGIVRRIPVVLPPLAEQRAIAGLLGALDDKIEQNRHTARALERLARDIFRAWFVDFEPVKAKAAGATAFPSMPQPVFDTLPARFVDSDIGPVPEGWEVKSLSEIAAFLNGLALQKYPPRGDGEDLRVIKIAELRKGSIEGADLANGDVPEEYVIDDRDLLFSWSGTLEAEFWFGGKGALNQHLFKVTSLDFPSWICFLWIRQHLPWFRTIAASKATTMGHIKRGHLQEAQLVVPQTTFIREADHVVGKLYDLHAQLMIESRKLAAMRDYLLPKLLSGEVRVEAVHG